ncbi:MAG: hypothetical protein NTW87_01980 [Planctomycetota bacterium]|nr:hypothetical protein [Planctomycetota bacterium]
MGEPAEQNEDLDVLVDEYLDGRMPPAEKARFEERVARDPALQHRLNSATRSVEMVQQALGWVTPGEDFEERVNTKIVSITQSGQNLPPYMGASGRSLTSEDPDAKLLGDPEAARERRRLIIIAIVAAVLFALAACAIGYSIAQGIQKPAPESSKKAGGER